MKRYSLLNTYFIIIITINFCISAVFYLTTVISTSYAVEQLSASISAAGFASGVFVIGTTISRIFIGKRLDSINLKMWLLGGLICYAFSTGLYFVSNGISILYITRLLGGISYGVCSSVCALIATRLIPSKKRGVGIGYYSLSMVVASASASFLGISLLAHNAFHLAFAICLGIIALTLILVFVMRVREAKTGAITLATPHNGLREKIPDYFEPSVWKISLLAFIVGFCYGGIIGFIGEFCKERDLLFAGSLFFAVYALVSIIARPIAGNLFDKKGYNFVLIPSIVFFALSLALIALADKSWILILAALFVGLGYGNFLSSGQSYAINIAPRNKIGLASSSYYMSLDLGVGIGPYILGIIVLHSSFGVMFYTCAGIICVCLALYMKLIFHKH